MTTVIITYYSKVSRVSVGYFVIMWTKRSKILLQNHCRTPSLYCDKIILAKKFHSFSFPDFHNASVHTEHEKKEVCIPFTYAMPSKDSKWFSSKTMYEHT